MTSALRGFGWGLGARVDKETFERARAWISMPHRDFDFRALVSYIFVHTFVATGREWSALEQGRRAWIERRHSREADAAEQFDYLDTLIEQFDPKNWKETAAPDGTLTVRSGFRPSIAALRVWPITSSELTPSSATPPATATPPADFGPSLAIPSAAIIPLWTAIGAAHKKRDLQLALTRCWSGGNSNRRSHPTKSPVCRRLEQRCCKRKPRSVISRPGLFRWSALWSYRSYGRWPAAGPRISPEVRYLIALSCPTLAFETA